MATTTLLRCGVIAGPFYLTVGVMQGLLRQGFDFGRHPLSVLANGSLGWIQTANFLFIGFFGGIMLPIGIAGIWFAVVVGWVWLAVLSLRQTRLQETAR